MERVRVLKCTFTSSADHTGIPVCYIPKLVFRPPSVFSRDLVLGCLPPPLRIHSCEVNTKDGSVYDPTLPRPDSAHVKIVPVDSCACRCRVNITLATPSHHRIA
jgi:hypothetical protein